MIDGLPLDVSPYSRTATWTEASVPAKLLQDHTTKQDVWGVIHVTSGALRYVVAEENLTVDLAPGDVAVIKPAQPHRVELTGPVAFFVEFHK